MPHRAGQRLARPVEELLHALARKHAALALRHDPQRLTHHHHLIPRIQRFHHLLFFFTFPDTQANLFTPPPKDKCPPLRPLQLHVRALARVLQLLDTLSTRSARLQHFEYRQPPLVLHRNQRRVEVTLQPRAPSSGHPPPPRPPHRIQRRRNRNQRRVLHLHQWNHHLGPHLRRNERRLLQNHQVTTSPTQPAEKQTSSLPRNNPDA